MTTKATKTTKKLAVKVKKPAMKSRVKKPAVAKPEPKPVGLFEIVFGWMWRK